MRKIFIILLYSQLFFSQSNEGKDNIFCIKTNPLSLVDVYGSYSYRIGLETKIYKNFAFSAEANEPAIPSSRSFNPFTMAGKANFAKIQNTNRNATSVHINKPNSGVSNCIKQFEKFENVPVCE